MAKTLHQIRKEFTSRKLDEETLPENPIELFEIWLDEAIKAGVPEPNAMNLATTGKDAKPSSRIVLLKEITSKGLVFFTNYGSKKAIEMLKNPFAAINFYWPDMERQIRIEGMVNMLSENESDRYFTTRPRESQIGTWASKQSMPLTSRSILEERHEQYAIEFKGVTIPRPAFWGGWLLVPNYIEFWQGRANRLHDRLVYKLEMTNWQISRLYP